MKKVKIVYNPFLLTTTVTVDGKNPNENSSLDFRQQRLQEWAEKLPQILLEEYRDKNIAIEFSGTLDDFTDLKEILSTDKSGVSFTFLPHDRKPDVAEVEQEVIKLYEEIQNGSVDALKDEDITEAFKTARNSEFEINVVATMSSGKSSLINAILGETLMPVAQSATTATIVRIIATNRKNYAGIAFDEKGNELYRQEGLTEQILTQWNKDKKISAIDIYGPVPCVSSVGMRLVIVDTPGPNNSRDVNHKKLTYEMLQKSEKSLVLFVMNGTQLHIDNEAQLLEYVCNCMKEGGKQSRDRFIFAVNKLDTFNPKNDKVAPTLENVEQVLDEKDIKNPNIFPTSAQVAIEVRTKEEFPEVLYVYEQKCERFGQEYHFESYYDFNHLPIPSRVRLGELACSEDKNERLLVHSGILSIEEAIRLYVNKYARTMKVRDLVDAFNKRLIELNAEADILDRIKHNQEEKEKLEKQISRIKKEIESGESARACAELIESIDLSKYVIEDVRNAVGELNVKVDARLKQYKGSTKVRKAVALADVKRLRNERVEMQAQLEANISSVFDKTFKRTYDSMMSKYRQHLESIGFKSTEIKLNFNVADFVGQELSDIDSLVKKNSKTIDEGHWTKDTRTVRGDKKTNWFWTPWHWGSERYEEITEIYDRWVSNNVEYVDMQKVVDDFYVPLQVELVRLEKQVPEHIAKEEKRLKRQLAAELQKIDAILRQKLISLESKMNTANLTAAQIAKQNADLEWLRGISDRVNQLVNYN